MTLRRIGRDLARDVDRLAFGPPVTHVYNPLRYARRSHEAYLDLQRPKARPVLLLGMNPGPWGMVQTGVPFGDVAIVRDWMGIEEDVDRPRREHPRRPVLGFRCPRREVSGSRLWTWARRHFGTAPAFFARFLVWNYCPLAFLEEGGRNRTPDRLRERERAPLFAACDHALRRLVDFARPPVAVGIGRFAESRLRVALAGRHLRIGGVLHPSPANPRANRDWPAEMRRGLAALGIRLRA